MAAIPPEGPAATCAPRAERPGYDTASAVPATAAASTGPSTRASATPPEPTTPGQLAADGPPDADEGKRGHHDERRDDRGRQRRHADQPAQPPKVAPGDGVTERRTHL